MSGRGLGDDLDMARSRVQRSHPRIQPHVQNLPEGVGERGRAVRGGHLLHGLCQRLAASPRCFEVIGSLVPGANGSRLFGSLEGDCDFPETSSFWRCTRQRAMSGDDNDSLEGDGDFREILRTSGGGGERVRFIAFSPVFKQRGKRPSEAASSTLWSVRDMACSHLSANGHQSKGECTRMMRLRVLDAGERVVTKDQARS